MIYVYKSIKYSLLTLKKSNVDKKILHNILKYRNISQYKIFPNTQPYKYTCNIIYTCINLAVS